MKIKSKAILLVLSALLLVAASVFGTLAYLTDTDTATNTFTVGKVAITLDEADVDDTDEDDNITERDKTNAYKLIPGGDYKKDPTVHVLEDSEASWLFVKVENGIAGIESDETGYSNINAQIKANGWVELNGVAGVYYKKADAYSATNTDANDHVVFSNFEIKGTVDGTDLESYANAEIKVTAYAIQYAGFEDDAKGAWEALTKQLNAETESESATESEPVIPEENA